MTIFSNPKLSDRVRPDIDAATWVVEGIEKLEQQLDAKEAEVDDLGDELRKDAARYRWLMKDDGHNALMSVLASLCASDDPIKPQMDDAIDRAIAATEH